VWIDRAYDARLPGWWAWLTAIGRSWWVRLLAVALAGLLNGHALWTVYQETGLLNAIGIDYKLYYLMAHGFWSEDPANAYHPDRWTAHLADLRPYYAQASAEPAPPGNTAYPPLFTWAFRPLLALPPHVGFLLWTAVNGGAALYLAWRAAQRFPSGQRFWVALLLCSALPLVSALASGQVQVLLACAFAESYLALRAGHEGRAGFWLGWLLLKPHYGLLLGLVLLWKRRWRVVAGVAGVGLLLLGASLLVGGLGTFTAFLAATRTYTDFSGTADPYVSPHLMTNWRALVLRGLRAVGDTPRLELTLAASVVTALGALALWRGPWRPATPRFPLQMTVLMLATVLTAYHSHSYGLLLLVMPLADLLVEWRPARVTRLVIVAAVVVPTLVIAVASYHYLARATLILTVLLLVCYGSLLVEGQLRREGAVAPAPVQGTG
jgi:hypothetical protein